MSKRVTPFEEFLGAVQTFSSGELVVSREHYSREVAASMMTDYLFLDQAIRPEWLEEERVRWSFPPWPTNCDFEGPCWMTGATGKGSKAVWLYDPNAARPELPQGGDTDNGLRHPNHG